MARRRLGKGRSHRRAFAFAEYLTFARAIPFEWSAFSADSLGNMLTAQGRGEAAYVSHEDTRTPMLAIVIPAGVLIRDSTPRMEHALESGLRQRIVDLVKNNSGKDARRTSPDSNPASHPNSVVMTDAPTTNARSKKQLFGRGW